MPESDRRTALVLVAAAVVALALRLAFLGVRMFHWDEARVGYLTLQFAATGHYHYRPIVHGPLLFLVNRVVFDVLGASDVTARLFVATVGGLLPLAAWLYRDHLDRAETAAFGVLLALNPVLLYYARFMRNDVLIASFSLTALGFLLRAHATGRHRYAYAAAVALALGFASKENTLLYLLCWLGGLVVLLDHWLVRGRAAGDDRLQPYVDAAARGWERLTGESAWRDIVTVPPRARGWAPTVLGAAVVFVALWFVLFAPRPDVYRASAYPGVLWTATGGAVSSFLGQWGGGGKHAYSAFFVDQGKVLVEAALVTTLLALLGFVTDRYRDGGPRALVTFAGAWALASLLGYPAITDVSGHWSVVHVVVPFTILGAVGAGLLVRRGRAALDAGDTVAVALAVVVLVAALGQVAYVDAGTSFEHPTSTDNVLVQYGQPADDIRPALDEIPAVAANNTGTDVLFYGSHFYASDEPSIRDTATPTGNWFNRLPLPWYLARANATVDSTTTRAVVNETRPPVVIAEAKDFRELHGTLTGYDSSTYRLTSTDTPIVVFVRNDTRT